MKKLFDNFLGKKTISEKTKDNIVRKNKRVVANNVSKQPVPLRKVAPKRTINVIEYDEKTKDNLLSFSGDVITASGNGLTLSKEEERCCVLLDDGTFIYSKNQSFSHIINNVKTRLLKLNFEIKKEIQVSKLDIINSIYANYYKRVSNSKSYVQNNVSEALKSSHRILSKAIEIGSSDIHIIVGESGTDIQYRVQGLIRHDYQSTKQKGEDILRSFYNQATNKPNSYEPRKAPFSASLIKLEDKEANFIPNGIKSCRLSYTPQGPSEIDGIQLVIRIFREDKEEARDISDYDFRKVHLRQLRSMRTETEGVIITSGPTGSGKTALCATMLRTDYKENNGEISIQTLEDPIEIHIDGAVQFAIQGDGEEKSNNYNKLIAALLRNDPDVVLISEVRNEMGVKAVFELAMSGHRIYTTLHSASAAMIVPRLQGLGAEKADTTDPSIMIGLIGQRLIRKMCRNCAVSLSDIESDKTLKDEVLEYNVGHYDKAEREDFFNLVRNIRNSSRNNAVNGCGISKSDRDVYFHLPKKHHLIKNKDSNCVCCHCNGEGVVGRTAIIEIVRPDEKYLSLLRDGRPSDAIKYWQDHLDGMLLREHAIQKMIEGISTPQDVIRAVGNLDRMDLKERGPKVFGELMK